MIKQAIKTHIKMFISLTVLFVILGVPVNVANANELYEPIASYTTKFSSGNTARANNIKLAAEKLDGVVIESGETFSYNDTIGPTSRKYGFKIAKIIVEGKEKKGYGGGVCQVSSTLYNAALDAGLTIVERHPHSKRVNYVPEGRDAATSNGGIDFKFRNDFDIPVIITAFTTKNSVTVTISY